MTKTNCSVCGSAGVQLWTNAFPLDYSSVNRLEVFKCAVCGHGYTDGAENIISIYEGGSYDKGEKFWHKWIRPFLNTIEDNKASYVATDRPAPAKALEIGSGKGRFLSALQKRGYDVYGIEPSARSFGMTSENLKSRVFNCTIEEISRVSGLTHQYDVIILWHVLEHLENPEKIIESISPILSPSGIILIAVPNFQSFQAIYGGKNWYHLDPSRHISHFSPKSLSIILEKCGYRTKRIFFDSHYQDFTGEIITLSNMVSPYKNVIFNTLRWNGFFLKKTGSILLIPVLIYSILMHAVLFVPSLLVTFVACFLKRSGTMIIISEKKNLSE